MKISRTTETAFISSSSPSSSSSSSTWSSKKQASEIAESVVAFPSISPTIFVHEVHVYVPSDATAESLQAYLSTAEAHAQRACEVIASEHNISDMYWSCHLVDLYKCPFKKAVTVAFQIGFSSTTMPLSRNQADAARELFEKELPKKLGLM